MLEEAPVEAAVAFGPRLVDLLDDLEGQDDGRFTSLVLPVQMSSVAAAFSKSDDR